MEISINLNDWIKVKLTFYGRQVFNTYYSALDIKPPVIEVDDNGYSAFQLWDFIQIFGSHIYMGAQNVIEPLEIIKEENYTIED